MVHPFQYSPISCSLELSAIFVFLLSIPLPGLAPIYTNSYVRQVTRCFSLPAICPASVTLQEKEKTPVRYFQTFPRWKQVLKYSWYISISNIASDSSNRTDKGLELVGDLPLSPSMTMSVFTSKISWEILFLSHFKNFRTPQPHF